MPIKPLTANVIPEAIRLLHSGEVVVIPTETIYGLAADAGNADAIAKIFTIKGRPSDNPLILHVDGVAMAKTYGLWTPLAEEIACHFWPGPLTLILETLPDSTLPKAITAGQPTVAVRCPAMPLLRDLIGQLGRPLAAPSANLSGRLSPTTPKMVFEQIGMQVPLILSAGACSYGLESTIVDARGEAGRILRAGSISFEMLAAVVPMTPEDNMQNTPIVPGSKYRHYAPQNSLRINANSVTANEVLVHFGPNPFLPKGAGHVLNLSPSGDLSEAGHNLYHILWQADKIASKTEGITGIAVAPIPNTGLGLTINERLQKASGL